MNRPKPKTRPSPVFLLACGCFNPPTNMHLRMFELARDYLRSSGAIVLGGIFSPVHNGYGKSGLVSSHHRCLMLEKAVSTSNWIRVDRWEAEQDKWSTTLTVVEHHQRVLGQRYAGSSNPPVVKLLVGADILESFLVPDLWKLDDVETILKNHGLVVITRAGCDPDTIIGSSPLLTRYRERIEIVNAWFVNDFTATAIRLAIRENRSVKYLLQDSVIEYIHNNSLYGAKCYNY